MAQRRPPILRGIKCHELRTRRAQTVRITLYPARRHHNVILGNTDPQLGQGAFILGIGQGAANITGKEIPTGAPAAPLPVNPGRQISPEPQRFSRQIPHQRRCQRAKQKPKGQDHGAIAPRVVPMMRKPAADGGDPGHARGIVVKRHAKPAQRMPQNPDRSSRGQIRKRRQGRALILQHPVRHCQRAVFQMSVQAFAKVAVIIGQDVQLLLHRPLREMAIIPLRNTGGRVQQNRGTSLSAGPVKTAHHR